MTIRVQRPDGMQQGGESPVEDAPFFYGGISRETAEWILWERGCQDGLFLLRQSGPDYVLSLCFQKSVLHYRIRRCSGAGGGGFGLCGLPAGGRQFRDPLELLASGAEGLACRPCHPCNRALDAMLPPTHWGLPDEAVRAFMLLKARNWGVDEARLDVSPTSTTGGPDLRSLLAKTLHEVQPWFHGPLSRAEAERRLQDSGHMDGKFLVRERDDASYALCLSHGGSVKHYKIDVAPSGDFAIQDGQQFPSLMSLISHYTLFSDGLWCPLTEACPRPGFVGSTGGTLGRVAPSGVRGAPGPGGTLPHSGGHRHHSSGSGSRLLGSVRAGILQRLVASISPQTMERSRTMPRLRSSGGGNVGGGGGGGSIGGNAGSSERPPSSRSEARLQKASSFDHLLPGFLSLLFASPDSGDGKGSTRSPREDPPPPPRWRATSTPVSFTGSPPASGMSSASPLSVGRRSSRPVPAPRPSLTRRDDQIPVYANREVLDAHRLHEEEPLVELGSPATEMPWCRRSASSPTVLGPGSRESDALLLSDLSSFPQPVPLPEPRSPSPPLIDFSECDDGGHYEEIELGSCVVSSSSSGSASSLVETPTAVIDTDSLSVVTAGDKAQTTIEDKTVVADETPLEGRLSEPASPERYLPSTDLAAGQGSRPSLSKEESESAYNAMRQLSTGLTTLDSKSIVLKDKIGTGNFGEVHRALFRAGALEVQFAVKSLKESLVDQQKEDILKEAHTMAQLDHPHIVRLVGVCESTSFLLVMELAPLGPLNRFLKLNKDFPVRTVLQLLVQVAGAMEYLEARQLVHRDLAARNVLLVNQGFAKVSDFGMSRALGIGKDYYKAEVAGKWPLKWYAPECIYFFKFSIKSDVWSFGVVLWEAFSYGERPYQGLMGQDILAMFESEERLERPPACPEEVYELMRQCWQYRPESRPSFTEVSAALRAALESCS
ncbi:tyrosine-protein kinase SYK-like [Ornithodoros turicata]|uniref:tyrosine-protein kinase SYK-like n=1 Tax=Ornithodoros turicata TaxID=34597 RepID=UPI003138D14D